MLSNTGKNRGSALFVEPTTKQQVVGKRKPVVRKIPPPISETSGSKHKGVAPVEPDTGDEYSEEEPEADIDSLR